MKNLVAAAALLAIALTGCSAPETPEDERVARPSVQTNSPAPVPSTPEPASLSAAIDAAKEDHATSSEAMHTLAALRRLAEDQLEPVMAPEDWDVLSATEMRLELDMLRDQISDREASVATQKYALQVEEAALDAGLIG